MITIENADKALKTYYLDAVSAQLDAVSPFYAAIEKNGTEVFGKEVKVTAVRGDSTRRARGHGRRRTPRGRFKQIHTVHLRAQKYLRHD